MMYIIYINIYLCDLVCVYIYIYIEHIQYGLKFDVAKENYPFVYVLHVTH